MSRLRKTRTQEAFGCAARGCALVISLLLSACNSDGTGSRLALGASSDCEPLPPESDNASRPTTIPALRMWQPASGHYTLEQGTRILAPPALASVARTFADDLSVQQGRRFVVATAGTARPGDIVLSLGDCDERLGAEGYLLDIGDQLQVQAPHAAGIFYGTRSLLQLLHQDTSIPAGRAADWPRYAERGLMVDMGRQYFQAEWIERHIRQIAYFKFNYLHLHFSDDQAFRIESRRFPEIVSEQHLTREEVRRIVALAARYHVEIVPEIDMPGHFGAALRAHPEFALRDLLGQPSGSALDITNDAARQFARELVEDFLPLFPGRYWHIGADEYMPQVQYLLYPQLERYAKAQYGANANAKDAIHDFDNWIAGIVQSHGKIARMWNDDMLGGSAVALDPDIIVEWWTNVSPLADTVTISPQQLLALGHRVMNAGWFPNYYTTGIYTNQLFLQPYMSTAYEDWSVNEFYGPVVIDEPIAFPPYRLAAGEPANLGAKLNIWTDEPPMQTTDEIESGIRPRLRVLGQQFWESPHLVPDYATFLTIIEAVGDAPGFGAP